MTQLKEDWDFVEYIIQNESTHPYFVFVVLCGFPEDPIVKTIILKFSNR